MSAARELVLERHTWAKRASFITVEDIHVDLSARPGLSRFQPPFRRRNNEKRQWDITLYLRVIENEAARTHRSIVIDS